MTTCKAHNWHVQNSKNSFCHVQGRGYNTQFLLYPWPSEKTEGIFAVLYVSIMGLRRCHKTTVSLHLYLQFFYWMLKIYSISQNQFQQRETKDRHTGVILLPFYVWLSTRHWNLSLHQRKGETASPCQISSKSVKPRPKYGEFWIFQDGGRLHLAFSKF